MIEKSASFPAKRLCTKSKTKNPATASRKMYGKTGGDKRVDNRFSRGRMSGNDRIRHTSVNPTNGLT